MILREQIDFLIHKRQDDNNNNGEAITDDDPFSSSSWRWGRWIFFIFFIVALLILLFSTASHAIINSLNEKSLTHFRSCRRVINIKGRRFNSRRMLLVAITLTINEIIHSGS